MAGHVAAVHFLATGFGCVSLPPSENMGSHVNSDVYDFHRMHCICRLYTECADIRPCCCISISIASMTHQLEACCAINEQPNGSCDVIDKVVSITRLAVCCPAYPLVSSISLQGCALTGNKQAGYIGTFQFQQLYFLADTAGVPSQTATCSYHTMAGNDN